MERIFKTILKSFVLQFMILLIALLICFFVMINLPPKEMTDSSISGFQFRSQTWSGNIRITEDTTFLPWTTLTVLPGTKVLFERTNQDNMNQDNINETDWTEWADDFIKSHNDPTGKKGYLRTHYFLYGKINATGTEDATIIFTSAQSMPEYADWDQLILIDGSILDNVEVSFSHNGVNVNGNNLYIGNSKIHDSLWSCVDIFSTGNTIENNEIYHCWHQGIGVKVKGPNTIKNNYVHDSQLSVNCENNANPTIEDSRFVAAPLSPGCKQASNNTNIERSRNVKGGTYDGILIYPAE